MWLTLRSVSPLLGGMALLMLGSSALRTLIALTMAEQQFPSWVAGIVMSAQFAGLVIGPFYTHRLIAAVGHIRAFATYGSVASAVALAYPFLIDPWVWGGLQFTQGFCLIGMWMCTESWLNDKCTNDIRGRVHSLYQITVYLFQGSAQFLLNLPDSTGFGLFILTSVLVSLSVVPIAAARTEAPPVPEPVRLKFRELYEISPSGMFACFASGALLGAVYGLGPFFAEQVGLERAAITRFMGAMIVGGLLLQWPFGRLSDRMDRRTVIVLIALGTLIVCLAIMTKTAGNGWGLMGLAALYGGFAFAMYPVSMAYANDQADKADLVALSGGLLVAYGIGAMLGPLGASVLMDLSGPGGLYQFCALIATITIAVTIWRMRQRRAPPVSEQSDFRPVPRTSPVASSMDPRAEPTADDGGD